MRAVEQVYRSVIFFKHPSSGRLQFLRFPSGSICGPDELPELAVMTEAVPNQLFIHPGAVKNRLVEQLGFSSLELILFSEFRLYLEVPQRHANDGLLPVFLVAVASKTAPAPPRGFSWLEMPESFELSYLEREILREAYNFVMT